MAEHPIGMSGPSRDTAQHRSEGQREQDLGTASARPESPAEQSGDAAAPDDPHLSRYARASVVRPKGAGPGAQPSLIEVGRDEARKNETPSPSREAASRRYSPIEPTRQVEPSAPAAKREPEAERVPFWKRIAMPRATQQNTHSAPPPPPLNLDPVLARIKQLEDALTTHQAATFGRLDNFEENITRLWELEEQMALTEVRERLALLEANQEEIADGMHAVSRNLSVLAVVIALAVAGGLFGISILL